MPLKLTILDCLADSFEFNGDDLDARAWRLIVPVQPHRLSPPARFRIVVTVYDREADAEAEELVEEWKREDEAKVIAPVRKLEFEDELPPPDAAD